MALRIVRRKPKPSADTGAGRGGRKKMYRRPFAQAARLLARGAREAIHGSARYGGIRAFGAKHDARKRRRGFL